MSIQKQNDNQFIIDEICAVIGLNFEPQIIQSILSENNSDFLASIAALIRKINS
jgi:hypothetical protein